MPLFGFFVGSIVKSTLNMSIFDGYEPCYRKLFAAFGHVIRRPKLHYVSRPSCHRDCYCPDCAFWFASQATFDIEYMRISLVRGANVRLLNAFEKETISHMGPLGATALRMVGYRFVDICMVLNRLPVLVLLYITDADADYPETMEPSMYWKWKIAAAIKHFK